MHHAFMMLFFFHHFIINYSQSTFSIYALLSTPHMAGSALRILPAFPKHGYQQQALGWWQWGHTEVDGFEKYVLIERMGPRTDTSTATATSFSNCPITLVIVPSHNYHSKNKMKSPHPLPYKAPMTHTAL